MAEAEEVIGEAARHATVFVRDLWRRHRPASPRVATLALDDVRPRLDALLTAIFGRAPLICRAQAPLPPTLLGRVLGRDTPPRATQALPATDGRVIALPEDFGAVDAATAAARYRVIALQQTARARRGAVARVGACGTALERDLTLLVEADAADAALIAWLPGLADAVRSLRRAALAERPALDAFSPRRRPLERAVRGLLAAPPLPAATAAQVHERVARLREACGQTGRSLGPWPLLRDLWTGAVLLSGPAVGHNADHCGAGADEADEQGPDVARLARRPEVRADHDDDDDADAAAAWMVQIDEPHLHAEDPMGLQRPADRDADMPAEECADLVSELSEARLVSTSQPAREVLLTEYVPRRTPAADGGRHAALCEQHVYPEWDWRLDAYRARGAVVHERPPADGDPARVQAILAGRGTLVAQIRRRFQMLRARQRWEARRAEGEEIDLAAWVDGRADFLAGRTMPENLYRARRRLDRSLAVSLLVDTSGSTDGFLSPLLRIIDVEREALLLVAVALEALAEPWCLNTFSGQGPQGVSVRVIKRFDEPYGDAVAARIAGLEPERYTRMGAAVRHAVTGLTQQDADHRLLVLLSDGKPNDIDEYEGRYGCEDLRQAVNEARLQHLHPFCLTVDRCAPRYLPTIFGPHGYALLPATERLPEVLIEWLRRLVTR